MGKRWVYIKTGEPVIRHGITHKQAPSVRAEVVEHRSLYTVRMPDGEEREVTDGDLQYQRHEVDPIDVVDDTASWRERDGATKSTHPSFGMIGIYHTSGSRPIHGSKLDSHQNFVSIKITRGASEDHSLGQNWHHGGGDRVIEVALSPARFAEFIAAPNRGDGVPCSIDWHSPVPGPGAIPSWPARDTEAQRIVDRVRGLGKEARERQASARAALEEVLAKIPASRREEALRLFDQGARIVDDTAPFLVNSAVEALEHRVAESKAEVEAFVATAIRSAGVKAIEADPALLLGHGVDGETQGVIDVEEG